MRMRAAGRAHRPSVPVRLHWSQKVLALALVAFAIGWFHELSSYEIVPDEPYGGDSYQQLGSILHIYAGNAPWRDPQIPGEWAFREWLSYLPVAFLAWVTPLSPLRADIFWPVVPLVGGGVLVYLLGRRTLGSPSYSLLMAVTWMGFRPSMVPTSRSFATMCAVPAFLLVLVSCDNSLRRRVGLGAMLGLVALSNGVAFLGSLLMLGLLLVARIAHDVHRNRQKSAPRASSLAALRASAPRRVAWFAPVAAAALPGILLFWGPLLFAYHGDIRNPSFIYGDGMRGWTVQHSLSVLGGFFADTTNPIRFAFSILALLGIYASFKQRHSHGGRWPLILLATGLLGTFHFALTMPLFQTHFVFYHFPQVFLKLAKVLLFFQAATFLHHRWTRPGRHRAPVPVGASKRAVAVIAVMGLLVAPLALSTGAEELDPTWRALAKDPVAPFPQIFDAAEWIQENTPKDAVFLSSPEGSSLLNGLTGRSVVVERRSHANPFIGWDERFADAAVMLFGQDPNQSKALFERYDVGYIIVDPLWVPLLTQQPIVTDPSYASYWQQNGLAFNRTLWHHDPVGQNRQLFDTIKLEPHVLGPAVREGFTEVYRQSTNYGDVMVLKRL